MGCANATCKTCQTCDKCQNTCDLEQSFCTRSSGVAPADGPADQTVSSYMSAFSWSGCVASDQVIFKAWTADQWSTLQQWIRDAYSYKQNCGQVSPPSMAAASTNQIITAGHYNDIVAALQSLGATSPSSVTGGPTGTIIRNYHATNLSQGTREAKFVNKNCERCNTNCDNGCNDCDVTCKSCQTCVSCQGQQHYSTCYGSCYSSS